MRSTSALVVARPTLRRSAFRATSTGIPQLSSTGDGLQERDRYQLLLRTCPPLCSDLSARSSKCVLCPPSAQLHGLLALTSCPQTFFQAYSKLRWEINSRILSGTQMGNHTASSHASTSYVQLFTEPWLLDFPVLRSW